MSDREEKKPRLEKMVDASGRFGRYEMVVDSDLREVNYEKYCDICKHADCPEHEDPCFECLDNPLNYFTEKPVKWEEKE